MEETAVTKEIGDVIAEYVCKINKKDYDVTLTDSYLQWHAAGSRGQKGRLIAITIIILSMM